MYSKIESKKKKASQFIFFYINSLNLFYYSELSLKDL